MSKIDEKHGSSPLPAGSKLKRWALLAEIAGAVAVVLSVAYLALQVSDNNKLLRSQAHYNALELGQRPLELVLENENLADVLLKCEKDPQTIDPTSWERCSTYYFLETNSWEYFYYQHIDGSIPPQLWRGADAYFMAALRDSGVLDRSGCSSGFLRVAGMSGSTASWLV